MIQDPVKKIIIIPARLSTNNCKKSQQNAEVTYNLSVYHNYDHPWVLCVISFLSNISLLFTLNKVICSVPVSWKFMGKLLSHR